MKNNKTKGHHSELDTLNPNHLKYQYRDLFFEVLGGVNTESYMSLRVMLVIRYNRKTERDHIDVYNNYQLTTFIKKVAESTGFSLGYIEEAFKALIDILEIYKHKQIEKQQSSYQQTFDISNEEQTEALKILTSKDLLKDTSILISQTGIIGYEKNSLLLYLIHLSRLQNTPLHAIIDSQYHYLQTKIGNLIPQEHKICISHLSDNALYYFEENELSHKVLLIEDTGNSEALRPLLELQQKGILTKTITQKDKDVVLRTIQRKVQGPICLSISTKKPENFNQNAVLSFVLHEDQTTIQEEQMIQYQRKQSAGLINNHKEEQTKEKLKNIQRMLKPITVINPYAEDLELPTELINKQISNVHYLQFIAIITFYKQYQKEQKANSITGELFIETSIADIQEANELLSTILLKKCDGLSTPARTYFEKLKKLLKEKSQINFKNADIHKLLHIPISSIKRYHTQLLSKGYIEATGEGSRATGFTYTITNTSEYETLQKSIHQTLNNSIKNLKIIHKQTLGSPKSRVAQNQSGLLQSPNSKALAR